VRLRPPFSTKLVAPPAWVFDTWSRTNETVLDSVRSTDERLTRVNNRSDDDGYQEIYHEDKRAP
jgi:hypothetical protein